ncbi:MAG TPA: hypothetical protein VF981_01745 [Gemmatimonadaceae bacterium]
MSAETSALDGWSPEQVAQGRAWVRIWKEAGIQLERIRRRELRELDTYRAIALLCGPASHLVNIPPRPGSGLVEQQRWFMRAARHH